MIADMSYSKNQPDTVTRLVVPKRVATAKNAENTETLLRDNPRQALIFGSIEYCTVHCGGYVVLDMGCELHGGVDITLEKMQPVESVIRVTFGESVMEALSTLGVKNAGNEHATRDFTYRSKGAASIKLGDTGYRFVKIEAVERDVYIKTVQGSFKYRDLEYRGSFECNDERINRIWSIGAYTVHLNMQDYLWDGIKRDRLVWIGDVNPELLTICSVFGDCDVVPKSLDLIMNTTPIGQWMNTLPSYTSWWVINQKAWYMQNGDRKYLAERAGYLFDTLKQIIGCVSEDGRLDYPSYFCDWSSNETPDESIGAYSVTIMGLRAGAYLCRCLDNGELAEDCDACAERLLGKRLNETSNKQMGALYAMAGGVGYREISDRLLLKEGAHGLSTFLGGYVLRAIASAGYMEQAIDIMRLYWGAMLDLGATTFWEDFDMDWITERTVGIDKVVPEGMLDVHGDFGKFCYTRFRHSLCHGWASGPTSFLSQTVTGIEILEPGCRRVRIAPELGGLEYIRTKYPTPHGVIEVEAERGHAPRIVLPEGVELVK